MSNVIVVATLKAQPGKEGALLSLLTETIEATHLEEGAVKYALHVSQQDPATFIVVEVWRSQEDLEGHFVSPHMTNLAKAAPDLFAAPPEIVFCDALAIGDAVKGVLAPS